MQESSAAQKKGNGQGNYKLIDARGPSLDSSKIFFVKFLVDRETIEHITRKRDPYIFHI